MNDKSSTVGKVAKNLFGFMLCTPNNAPVMWADSTARALNCFAIAKRGSYPAPNNVNLESELMASGWKIKRCTITVTYDE
jgi:hypothetical protein